VSDRLVGAGMALVARSMAVTARLTTAAPAPPRAADAGIGAGNVLVVSLAEIGDAVLLSAFVRELRAMAPAGHVTLVVRPAVAPLFEACPHVNEVIGYDVRARRAFRPLTLPPRAWSFARRRLRSRDYEMALVPRWDTDQYLATSVALFSGARRRVAYSEHVNARKAVLGAGLDALLTDVVPATKQRHEVERNLDILRFLGADVASSHLELWLTDADRGAATRLLEEAETSADRRTVAFGIGGAHPKRRWPVERFVALGRALQKQHGAHIVVLGGPEDGSRQAALIERLDRRVTGLAGRTTLRQTGAVLERCQLFVGNDSGPLHLAAAAGVPCVEVSCHPRSADPEHPNSPERFGPWRVRHAVLRPATPRPPCDRYCAGGDAHCILAVSVDVALAHCDEMLHQPAPEGVTTSA
jgi:heptosyltransferase-2